jgi:hypothetical protein
MTIGTKHLIFVIFTLTVLLISSKTVRAQTSSTYSPQVGAWGDSASIGNNGVQIEIQTHIYSVSPGDTDGFWVGDDLVNGAFIQFGYIFQSGDLCLHGNSINGVSTCTGSTQNVGPTDARWFWEYFPIGTGNDYYSGVGQENSAGDNGTWHTYSIEPNAANDWTFVMDGQLVDSLSFQATISSGRAYFAAEKATSSSIFANLGPAAFRNLQYLKQGKWHHVVELTAIVGCGVNTDCNISPPYGVETIGANSVVAGSDVPRPADDTLLWSDGGVLSLTLPYNVIGSVDGSNVTGEVTLPLLDGVHTIILPQTVAIDNGRRSRFSYWSDGSTTPARNITVTEDMNLTATYVPQFELTVDAPGTGGGWYDQDATAQFSVPTTIPSPGVAGIFGVTLHFQGWYENGALLTESNSGSIIMDTAHSLHVEWSAPDYTWPIINTSTLAGIVVAFALYRRHTLSRERENITLPKQPKEEVSSSDMYCRFCRSVIARDSTFCRECGAKLT